MKASQSQIERALDTPGGDVRAFLLHGPDESQSRGLTARLARRLGDGAERVDLSGAVLKADPARLSDEASAFSLFGGARYILVEAGGDEIYEAFEALLQAPTTGNPVAILTGALRKDSRLLKRALAEPCILAFASYLPEGGNADRLAVTIGRDLGLQIDSEVARALALSTGGDRALLAAEIEKFALYLDAAPGRSARLEIDTYASLAADNNEGDLSRLIDAALGGRGDAVVAETARLAANGTEGIIVLRSLLRRLMLLAQLRALVDGDESVDAVMGGAAGRAVFFKDKPIVTAQLSRWTGISLARAIDRVGEAERAIKRSGSAGALLVEAELLAIARSSNRR